MINWKKPFFFYPMYAQWFRKTGHFVGYKPLLLNFFWWHFIKIVVFWRRKEQMFCWNLYSTDVLTWIFPILSFEKFPICLVLIWIVRHKFINFVCSSRGKVLCLPKSSFYICSHPLTFMNLTWKLFMCKRKLVKIVIISP